MRAAPDILAAVKTLGVRRKPTIAIVGAGRVGTALALRLAEAGYKITEVIGRAGAKSRVKARRIAEQVRANVTDPSTVQMNADAVWFCVPDGQILSAAGVLARFEWKDKFAFHASGVRSSDELSILRQKGASVASIHPLMTFIPGVVPELAGVTFAVEGDPQALRMATGIVRGLGGEFLRIRKQDKAAYHAFATMICPLLLSLLATSEKVGGLAGISRPRARKAISPIVRQTLANYEKFGAAEAFTGPIMRGDVETVRRHLQAIADEPAVERVYLALAKAGLKYLPTTDPTALVKILR